MTIPLGRWHGWLPAALLALGTVLVWALDLDRAVTAAYYDASAPDPFPFGWSPFWNLLYTWGALPGFALAAGSLVLLGLDGRTAVGRYWRRMGLLALLALLLGPMLTVNGLLKEFYGRPRPRQVEAFGGGQPFAPVLAATLRRDENGFPAGHAAGGYSILPLYFMLRERYPRAGWFALAAGLIHGSLMGWMRVIQGGHFLSDVLWAGGITWFAALLVAWWLGRGQAAALRRERPTTDAAVAWRRGALLATAAAVLLVFMVSLPIREYREHTVPLPPQTRRVEVALRSLGADAGFEPRQTGAPGNARLVTRVNGRGLPWWRIGETLETRQADGDLLRIDYALLPPPVFGVYATDTTLVVPPGTRVSVERSALAAHTTQAARTR